MDTNKMRDLKVLAEAATPGQWMTDGEYVNEHGNVLFAYVAHENSGRIAEAFANCLVKISEQCRANAAFIAAANPSTVLALLAEIERIGADRKACWEEFKVQRRQLDQLKAENEALRDDANFRAIQSLRADCEALRKDAERYRWTAIDGNWLARMFGKWRAHTGEYGEANPTAWYPSRGEAIDAAISHAKAMAKEASHG